MSIPGDIAPRRDTDHEMYVVVLSNALHMAANTARLITCPFIPGRIPDDTMAMVIAVDQPAGAALPELVQWLPSVALDEPIGNVGQHALSEAATIVAALISSY